ncbi:hypothetical protein Tco_1061022, partial [Tanacetum coccineum]
LKGVSKTISLIEAIHKLHDPQCELLFLRNYARVAKLSYALRTCSPLSFLEAQVQFDQALRTSLKKVVTASGSGFGDWKWRLATLPIKLGGLGILSAGDIIWFAVPMFSEGNLCPSCNALWMDQWRHHAVHYFSKVWVKFRNYLVCDMLDDICSMVGIMVRKEAPMGFLSEEGKDLRLADLLLFNWLQGKDACLDLTGISPFVGMGATSWAPEMLGEYIANDPLTPLVKPGGGIRPIDMGTVWRRLVFKAYGDDVGLSMLLVDFKNAFNLVDREVMLREVCLRCPIKYSFSLSLHAWYLDDGTIVGDAVVVGKVLELIMEDGSGLYFTMRTRPPRFFESIQRSFDVALRSYLERIVTASGPRFGDWQWRLATLPFAFGGLGVYSAGDVLNYAFLASRLQPAGLQTKLLWHIGIVSLEPIFDDALSGFNTSIETDLLSNLRKIAAPKLMKKMTDIYFTRVSKNAESTFLFLLDRWPCGLLKGRIIPLTGLGHSLSPSGTNYEHHVVSCVGILGIKHHHNVVRDTLVDICYHFGILAGKEVDIRRLKWDPRSDMGYAVMVPFSGCCLVPRMALSSLSYSTGQCLQGTGIFALAYCAWQIVLLGLGLPCIIYVIQVRVGERQRAEGKPKLLDTTMGHVVPLLPVSLARALSKLEASVEKLFDEGGSGSHTERGDSVSGGHGVDIPQVSVTAEIVAEDAAPVQPKRQRKRKTDVSDAGEPSHPPKKLREDHETSTGPSVAEREGGNQSDFMVGANLRTITAPPRFIISLDSSHHSGANIAEVEVDSFARPSVPLMTMTTTVTSTANPTTTTKEIFVEPSIFGGGSSSRAEHTVGGFSGLTGSDFIVGGIRTVMVDEFAPPKFFALIRGMKHDQLFTKFNVGAAGQMSLSAKVRMHAEFNIRKKRRLCSFVEEKDSLLKSRDEDEIESLKERSTALENEKGVLDVRVADLASTVKVREQEAADSDDMVTTVKLQNDRLADHVYVFILKFFL